MQLKRLLSKTREISAYYVFLLSSVFSILSLLAIALYIFWRGAPAISEIGLIKFLTGTVWQPSADIYGILPMILASLYITLGAIVLGVPIGLLSAVFLYDMSTPKISSFLRTVIELLAGIPSVVYGFFGLTVIVPFIAKYFGGAGNSMLAAIIILAIMILPTIISTSETSLKEVPLTYKEGSLAVGASKIRTIFKVIIPSAKSGIFSGIILGIGRAAGETMAVILVAGNTVRMPSSILDSVRTLTANCALEMGYASGLHSNALFATGIVLFLFIIILNIALSLLNKKAVM